MLEILFDFILLILGVCIGFFFLPLLIGIFIGVLKIQDGNIVGGIIAMILGLIGEVIMLKLLSDDSGGGGSYRYDDYGCPYCGSGDTDGNPCYTCDDDY